MKRKVYDKDGREYEVEAIDAREWVASGSYTFNPPEALDAVERLMAPPADPAPPEPPSGGTDKSEAKSKKG